MATDNLININEDCRDPNYTRFLECKGARPNCDYAMIGRRFNAGEDYHGVFGLAIDSFFLFGFLENPSLDSCNPVQISGTTSFGSGFVDYPSLISCFFKCFGFSESGYFLDLSCMTATWVITEASAGGGGGGPVL